jgi:hypothetical protein
VTALVRLTGDVVIEKVGELVVPSGTRTVAGGTAALFELLNVTAAPPVGAGAFSVTRLAVVGVPPTVIFGLRVNADKAIGLTVRTRVLVVPL